jgi:adenosylhomocysteine/aminodeoxyfutalosine nucleosidase
MIKHFDIDILLFSGVAGALSPELEIGDLIYATKLVQHDLDLTAFGHPHGYVPEGKVFVETTPIFNRMAQDVAKKLNIKIKGGVIATGDQFIADKEKKRWIRETFGADAIEMEGASVATVADAFNVPVFILRAISDSADGKADVDFDAFLKESAKVSAEFIFKMINHI